VRAYRWVMFVTGVVSAWLTWACAALPPRGWTGTIVERYSQHGPGEATYVIYVEWRNDYGVLMVEPFTLSWQEYSRVRNDVEVTVTYDRRILPR
jgi:hypothetical protein